MGRTLIRLVAGALSALCVLSCAQAAHAAGARTIADASSIKPNALTRGQLFDGAFYSGYSVAYWNAPLHKGDRITIHTKAGAGDTPPCQLLFMPGTDDINVGATTPLLDPASSTRDGSRTVQRFVATTTGTYVLAMTNDDIYLSAPLQCLDAPSERPFTFQVKIAHRGSGKSPARRGGERAAHETGAPTQVVERSLWLTAVP